MKFHLQEDGQFPGALGGTWIAVDDSDLGRRLWVRVADRDGELACTGLVIGGDEAELTATDLRRISLSEILTALAGPRRAPRYDGFSRSTSFRAGRRRPVAAGSRPTTIARSRARTCKLSASIRVRPVQAFVRAWPTTEPTAHRWLKTAVERGFLKEDER